MDMGNVMMVFTALVGYVCVCVCAYSTIGLWKLINQSLDYNFQHLGIISQTSPISQTRGERKTLARVSITVITLYF